MKQQFCVFVLICVATSAFSQKNKSKEEWISLFNHKDLSNWTIKITDHEPNDNYLNTFKIDSGILKINYDQYTEFGKNYGHIYYNTPYSYYKLIIEYRFVGVQTKGGAVWNVRNSGVMFHSQPPSTLRMDQEF